MPARQDHSTPDPAGAEEHALALASPHRFVVIASPQSMAWIPALEHSAGVFVLDPLREADADAIGPLQPPNDGPPDTIMPRWAVYDCAEVPGAVIGLLRTPVSSPYRRPLDPLAVVLATPHAEPHSWHLYGLTVRAESGPSPEIRTRMVRHAMSILRAERVTLVVPWTSRVLPRLAARETVELLAARTPLHGPTPAATLLVHRDASSAPTRRDAAPIEVPADDGPLDGVLRRLQSMLDDHRRLVIESDEPGATTRANLRVREARP
ncbi:MAG: hypothetical protein U0572_15045 [Phycisphaerales bacterium]